MIGSDHQKQDRRPGRTTVPGAVRRALDLRARDELACRIGPERVMFVRADRPVVRDPFSVFGEWSSEADRLAYVGL
jgi:bifunctional DNA-binding transcriptional regulator/antitoxin component of YhaV-PrlF toxin-antitoxin module